MPDKPGGSLADIMERRKQPEGVLGATTELQMAMRNRLLSISFDVLRLPPDAISGVTMGHDVEVRFLALRAQSLAILESEFGQLVGALGITFTSPSP
jgi:hypothetical protein